MEPHIARYFLHWFNENTWTIELPEDCPERRFLEQERLIARHPSGPLGSRCSYYRTAEGMRVWYSLAAAAPSPPSKSPPPPAPTPPSELSSTSSPSSKQYQANGRYAAARLNRR